MVTHSKKIENYTSLIGILFILSLLFVFSTSANSAFLNFIGFPKTESAVFTFSRILYWVSVLLLWIYAHKIEKQNLLIWEERNYQFKHYIFSIIGLFVAIIISALALRIILNLIGVYDSNARLVQVINVFKDNQFLIFFTAITAGVIEELIFRGYIQPRLDTIFKNRHIAILISSILFGLLHYKYGTIINVVGPFIIGIIFSYYYWKYRNIKILILFHTLWDILSIYVHLKLLNHPN